MKKIEINKKFVKFKDSFCYSDLLGKYKTKLLVKYHVNKLLAYEKD